MSEPIQFSMTQDKLLLQEAVAVRPFSHGKGMGWKLIASRLAKSNQFPTAMKSKTVRERILELMEDYTQRSTEEFEDSHGDDEEKEEMDENLLKLVNLRIEAMKMVTQSRSPNSIDDDKKPEKKDLSDSSNNAKMAEDQEEMGYNSTGTTMDLDGSEQKAHQNPSTASGSQNVTGLAKGKRKLQTIPKPRQPRATAKDNVIYKFLEEREAKRLKLREEELTLRREELEERKKLVRMVEERLEEEKKIREDMFKLMNEVLKK